MDLYVMKILTHQDPSKNFEHLDLFHQINTLKDISNYLDLFKHSISTSIQLMNYSDVEYMELHLETIIYNLKTFLNQF